MSDFPDKFMDKYPFTKKDVAELMQKAKLEALEEQHGNLVKVLIDKGYTPEMATRLANDLVEYILEHGNMAYKAGFDYGLLTGSEDSTIIGGMMMLKPYAN